jgi:predicted regulator of Ras-like GTPase activity (Roadblock/LC7/MglB family)
MNPINQPSINPTRKLTAATIAAAVVSVSGLIVRNTFPTWYDDEVWSAMTPIVIFAVGYFVKDLPNG